MPTTSGSRTRRPARADPRRRSREWTPPSPARFAGSRPWPTRIEPAIGPPETPWLLRRGWPPGQRLDRTSSRPRTWIQRETTTTLPESLGGTTLGRRLPRDHADRERVVELLKAKSFSGLDDLLRRKTNRPYETAPMFAAQLKEVTALLSRIGQPEPPTLKVDDALADLAAVICHHLAGGQEDPAALRVEGRQVLAAYRRYATLVLGGIGSWRAHLPTGVPAEQRAAFETRMQTLVDLGDQDLQQADRFIAGVAASLTRFAAAPTREPRPAAAAQGLVLEMLHTGQAGAIARLYQQIPLAEVRGTPVVPPAARARVVDLVDRVIVHLLDTDLPAVERRLGAGSAALATFRLRLSVEIGSYLGRFTTDDAERQTRAHDAALRTLFASAGAAPAFPPLSQGTSLEKPGLEAPALETPGPETTETIPPKHEPPDRAEHPERRQQETLVPAEIDPSAIRDRLLQSMPAYLESYSTDPRSFHNIWSWLKLEPDEATLDADTKSRVITFVQRLSIVLDELLAGVDAARGRETELRSLRRRMAASAGLRQLGVEAGREPAAVPDAFGAYLSHFLLNRAHGLWSQILDAKAFDPDFWLSDIASGSHFAALAEYQQALLDGWRAIDECAASEVPRFLARFGPAEDLAEAVKELADHRPWPFGAHHTWLRQQARLIRGDVTRLRARIAKAESEIQAWYAADDLFELALRGVSATFGTFGDRDETVEVALRELEKRLQAGRRSLAEHPRDAASWSARLRAQMTLFATCRERLTALTRCFGWCKDALRDPQADREKLIALQDTARRARESYAWALVLSDSAMPETERHAETVEVYREAQKHWVDFSAGQLEVLGRQVALELPAPAVPNLTKAEKALVEALARGREKLQEAKKKQAITQRRFRELILTAKALTDRDKAEELLAHAAVEFRILRDRLLLMIELQQLIELLSLVPLVRQQTRDRRFFPAVTDQWLDLVQGVDFLDTSLERWSTFEKNAHLPDRPALRPLPEKERERRQDVLKSLHRDLKTEGKMKGVDTLSAEVMKIYTATLVAGPVGKALEAYRAPFLLTVLGEAVTFTAMEVAVEHVYDPERRLDAAEVGTKFLKSLGLMTALRGAGRLWSVVGRQRPLSAALGGLITSYIVVQAFSLGEFAWMKGRLPNADELAEMSGHNLLMMLAAMSAARTLPSIRGPVGGRHAKEIRAAERRRVVLADKLDRLYAEATRTGVLNQRRLGEIAAELTSLRSTVRDLGLKLGLELDPRAVKSAKGLATWIASTRHLTDLTLASEVGLRLHPGGRFGFFDRHAGTKVERYFAGRGIKVRPSWRDGRLVLRVGEGKNRLLLLESKAQVGRDFIAGLKGGHGPRTVAQELGSQAPPGLSGDVIVVAEGTRPPKSGPWITDFQLLCLRRAFELLGRSQTLGAKQVRAAADKMRIEIVDGTGFEVDPLGSGRWRFRLGRDAAEMVDPRAVASRLLHALVHAGPEGRGQTGTASAKETAAYRAEYEFLREATGGDLVQFADLVRTRFGRSSFDRLMGAYGRRLTERLIGRGRLTAEQIETAKRRAGRDAWRDFEHEILPTLEVRPDVSYRDAWRRNATRLFSEMGLPTLEQLDKLLAEPRSTLKIPVERSRKAEHVRHKSTKAALIESAFTEYGDLKEIPADHPVMDVVIYRAMKSGDPAVAEGLRKTGHLVPRGRGQDYEAFMQLKSKGEIDAHEWSIDPQVVLNYAGNQGVLLSTTIGHLTRQPGTSWTVFPGKLTTEGAIFVRGVWRPEAMRPVVTTKGGGFRVGGPVPLSNEPKAARQLHQQWLRGYAEWVSKWEAERAAEVIRAMSDELKSKLRSIGEMDDALHTRIMKVIHEIPDHPSRLQQLRKVLRKAKTKKKSPADIKKSVEKWLEPWE